MVKKYDSYPLHTEQCFWNERTTHNKGKLHVGNHKKICSQFLRALMKKSTLVQEYLYLFVAYISQILFSKMEELSSIHIKKYELNFIDQY